MRFFKAAALFGLTASTCAIAVPQRTTGSPSDVINVVGNADNDHVSTQNTPSALDTEFAKLAEIKSEMATIYARVRKQEHTIIHMMKQDFKQCGGIQCMLQMAMHNAPEFAHLIAEHFSREKVRLNKKVGEITLVETLESPEPPSPQADEVGSKKENPTRPAPPPFDGEHRPHRPFEGEHPHRPFEGEYPHRPFEGEYPHRPFEGEHPHRPFEGEHPHRPFHGELPHPPFKGDHPPPFHGEYPPPHNGDHPPPRPHHKDGPHGPPGRHGRHGHGRPSMHHIRHERFRIMKAALALLAGSFLLILLFKAIRKHVLCCKDPRRRADRASRNEERRARCEYRRAAHRHRISSWWAAHNPRRASAGGTTDYEEKRALILQQEGVLEAAMQEEIRDLETAAELEEGRGRPHIVSRGRLEHNGQPSNSRLNEQQIYAISDYSAPPPQYEAELDEDVMVVNGFGYTPSNTDDTPESSVVDFSPRMSTETLLTNISKTDRMD